MVIAYDEDTIQQYMKQAVEYSQDRPVLIDKFLEDAIEIDVDALSDGEDVVIGGIMQHIEEAGIHSGDSSCVLPAVDIPEPLLNAHARIHFQTGARSKSDRPDERAVRNSARFACRQRGKCGDGRPRPSKRSGAPQPHGRWEWQSLRAGSEPARLPHRALRFQSYGRAHGQDCRAPHDRPQAARVPPRNVERGTDLDTGRCFYVKSPVFPWSKFPGVDTVLGPEMRSTGEVMGVADNFGEAFAKAQIAAGQKLPTQGTVFISVTDHDKPQVVEVARRFVDMGFKLVATHGTADVLEEAGLAVERVYKVKEGRPNAVDLIKADRIQLIVNTPHGPDPYFDEKAIRRAAVSGHITTITTLSAARAAAEGIAALQRGEVRVQALQALHAERVGRT